MALASIKVLLYYTLSDSMVISTNDLERRCQWADRLHTDRNRMQRPNNQ